MKKFYFLAALVAGTALTSCTSEDDLALSPPNEVQVEEGYVPIMFSSLKNNITRGDVEGAAAADSLGGKFVVSGFKSTTLTANPGSMVFDNYLVEWEENSAHKTESNSSNWEYVDKGLIPHAETNGITRQTIKYWDYSQKQYDFIAWSTGKKTAVYDEAQLGDGKVLVSNITPNSKTTPLAWATGRIAYSFTGSAEDLSQCYIADLVTVYKGKKAEGTGDTYNVVWEGYQEPVKLRFRQLGTKVRIGIYETVPGYSVKDVKFYTAAAVDLNDETKDYAHLFTTTAGKIYKKGTYTVSFPTVDAPTNVDNNQAHIAFEASTPEEQDTKVKWGSLNYTIAESGEKGDNGNMEIYLGRTSNTASFAGSADENYYQVFLPNNEGTNLNLRVDYTLEAIDGCGEEIKVRGATAQVPSIYATWKPGYAYTYLFKISDKTNGHTGVYDPTHPDDTSINSDPAGLFPITFDAIVVNAEEDKTQETITLVATPSITTYQNGSKVVNNNEYTVITPDPTNKITGEIYVTVNDGEASYVAVTDIDEGDDITGLYTKDNEDKYHYCESGTAAEGITYYRMKPILENGDLATLTGKAALYTVANGTTEAEVIDALQMQEDVHSDAITILGRNGVALTEAAGDNALSLTNSVTYGVDGNTITVQNDQAAKFVPAAGTTYAFVYTKTDANPASTKKMYQAVTKRYEDDPATTNATEQPESVENLYRYKLVAATADQDVQKGVTYFENNAASTPAITAFLGQNVSNLYTRSGEGTEANPYVYTIASGYAKTNTTYYYTLDNGQSYLPAKEIAFADFSTSLFVYDETANGGVGGYVNTTDTAPVNGTAYYFHNTTTDKYEYCVISPQRTNGLYVIKGTSVEDDSNFVACGASDVAVKGMTYFDMYTKNNGVYYAKVIKIAAEN